jgi:DNA-binding NarL/FixJ family response regulator
MEQTISRKKLVLVEDYKLIRIGLKMVLDGDSELEVAGEGETAMQGMALIEKHRPELVILDIGLPDMDGFQLTREIRQLYPDIKILVLTSHESEDEVMEALAAGANAYCLKDIMSEHLVEVVKSVCEGAIWLDPRLASRALRVFSETANDPDVYNRLSLNNREREVLRLLAEGLSNTQIVRALDADAPTIKTIILSIVQKLSNQERMDAARKALQQASA